MAEFLIGNIKGDSAKITQATATVDETTGTPSVNVTLGGTESERTLNFAFSGLKGEKGEKGDTGEQGDAGVSAINETININDEAPTYTEATTLATLTSGEKISVAFGKIKKAISSLISHLADTTKHITAAERTSWNNYASSSGYELLKTQTVSFSNSTFTNVFNAQITGFDITAYDEYRIRLNGSITKHAFGSDSRGFVYIGFFPTPQTAGNSSGAMFSAQFNSTQTNIESTAQIQNIDFFIKNHIYVSKLFSYNNTETVETDTSTIRYGLVSTSGGGHTALKLDNDVYMFAKQSGFAVGQTFSFNGTIEVYGRGRRK